MKPDRWRKVDELFEAALEHEPARRASFLDQACGTDKDLRREVEKMLDFEKQSEDFIKTDVFDIAARLITQPRLKNTSDSIDDARFVPGEPPCGCGLSGGIAPAPSSGGDAEAARSRLRSAGCID